MPPKKQAKKGINYRPAVAAKDIIPATVKEPPREPRSSKPIENFPEIVKKYQFELKDKAQPWPGNEAAKAFDFGIQSTNQFKDAYQPQVRKLLSSKSHVIEWKSMQQAQHLQQLHRGQQSQQKLFSGQHTKSLHEIKYIDEETEVSEEKPIATVMIESFMRDETVEELEKRKKEEAEKAALAAKDKKKAPKGKEEVKEEGPVKVRDVEMADIVVNEGMLPEGRWIGSQLQLIKQRNICDIYTQQAIWKKIYPQQDGLPVICKSGRYWVKLYYMGKEVKVEIDDQLPLNSQLNYLLPRSAKDHERWPLILSKALIKLSAINNAGCDMVGNGLILYALTGLIGQKISLHNFQQWDKLGDQLTDKHYLDKDVFVTCYSSRKFKPHPASNLVTCGADLHKLLQNNNSEYQTGAAERSRSSEGKRGKEEEKVEIREEIDSKIMSDYAYFVGDHLFNGGFNMVYAQKISNKEMRLRQEYNQLTKVSLSNKARDQKLEYRRKKKEKKQRIHLQQQKRQNLLKKPPQPYHFLKICADVTIQGDYSTDQIGIAKKCILNDLPYPPNYDIPEARPDDNKSTRSYSVTNKVKEEKEEMTIKPLDDFSAIPNAIDPLNRNEKGVWVKDEDFLASFQYLQIFYDPNKLAEKQVCRVEYSVNSEFTIDENKEVLILEKDQARTTDTTLVFGFSPEFGTKSASIKPYTMLQKFNFEEFSTIESSPALQDNISCFMMKLSNSNHVFKILTLSKGGYCYWISSNAKFRLTSIAGYLTDFQGYTSKSFPCDYPAVEADKYNLFFRTKLQTTQDNTVVIRLKNIDPYILKNLRYKLITISPSNLYVDTTQQGVHQNRFQSTLIVSTYLRLELKSNQRYYLLLEGLLPFNIPQGNLEVEVLSKTPAVTFELVQQVQPLRYVEKYNVNKYGLICRERLFTNNDNVATVYFQLVNGEVGVGGGAPVDKKAGKKGGKEQAQPEVIESEMKEKRPVKLEFFCGDQLVVSEYGYNQALLSNIVLKSTKGDANSYYIQASFDLRQWPEAKNFDENTSKIFWSLKVNSYESIAIVRDTFKQDQQKDIKKQWEDKQPGRAERAKKSRKRYLLQLKSDAGEQLTEEEMKIITAPRLTKKQLLEEQRKANEDKKGAKGAKKDDKKGKDAKGKEEVVKPVEEKPRELPKSQNNVMVEIKDFLKHLEAERVLYEQKSETAPSKIRSPDDLRSIQQGSLLAAQERVAIIQRNIEDRQITKIHQKEQKQQLQSFISQTMEGYKKGWQEYVKSRNQIFERSKTRTEKEKQLIQIAKSEKPNISEADLGKLITEYEAIEGSNQGIVNVLVMVKKNIRIGVLNDKLAAALAAFDIEEINRIDEQMKKDSIQGVTPELLQQMSDLMEQAKKNPNYILEKQTEAKKGKKGKK